MLPECQMSADKDEAGQKMSPRQSKASPFTWEEKCSPCWVLVFFVGLEDTKEGTCLLVTELITTVNVKLMLKA